MKKVGFICDERYPDWGICDVRVGHFQAVVSVDWYRRACGIIADYEELMDEIEAMEKKVHDNQG